MLAIADRLGHVGASVPGLAALANVSIEDCLSALDKLRSPDPYSRTKDFDGRRIENVDGGFVILNYVKYRELGKKLDRVLYLREKQREHRSKSTVSTDVNKTSTPASASVYASSSKEGGCRGETKPVELPDGFPTSEDAAVACCMSAGLPEEFVRATWNLAAGRGGLDSRGQVIQNFARHCKAMFSYKQSSDAERAALNRKPKQSEGNIVKTLIEEFINDNS